MNTNEDFKEQDLVQDELHPVLWDDGRLKPDVAKKLLSLAQATVEDFPINIKVVDIIITGSIANYNWTAQSDIDLHILVNYDSGVVGDYQRRVALQYNKEWKKKHDITIEGVPAEIFIQDASDELEPLGIYSLLKGKWIQKPPKFTPHTLSTDAQKLAHNYAVQIARLEVDFISGMVDAATVHKRATLLKHKLKQIREQGLAAQGIFSTGNLVYKTLRNWGYKDKLNDLKILAFDKQFSKD